MNNYMDYMNEFELERDSIYLERSYNNIIYSYHSGKGVDNFVDAMRIQRSNGSYIEALNDIIQDAQKLLNCEMTFLASQSNAAKSARYRLNRIIEGCNREKERCANYDNEQSEENGKSL